ncbi:MAG TPA: BTAD domain-containing putative transcriptional regulator [Gemmatimonadaceae bacterium]|nr:BTAD domain-containing putative transcriptional regulator [Gemmatimonadaceae bacterium]
MIHLRLLGAVSLAADNADMRSVLRQPKRLALLAYLAAAARPGEFHRRDALVALFWPESTESQARRALRQALHHLRHALGPSVITNRGDSDIRLAPGSLWCDVVAFRQAMETGKLEAALELYRGELLEAFSIAGISVQLERWLEEERGALRTMATAAACSLAERAASDGQLPLATQWARRALTLSGDDESALRRLIDLLDRSGDRAGALRAAEEFGRRMRTELGVEPAPETAALIAEIRTRTEICAPAASRPGHELRAMRGEQAGGSEPPEAPASPPSATSTPSVPGMVLERRRARSWFRRPRLVAAAIALVVLAGAAMRRATRHPDHVIAVGSIENLGSTEAASVARLLPSLLETELAQLPGQRTVSDARLHEVLGQIGASGEAPASVSSAAKLAGATELLDGALYEQPDAGLRLDLHRVDLETGEVRRAYQVLGATPFELADRAAERIAADLGLPMPRHHSSERTSTSLVAQGFFEEGLRTFYQVGMQQANPFFLAALREDSTCAMCAYYASITEDGLAALEHLRAAARLAKQAPERDRLYIQAAWSTYAGVRPMLSAALSLAARYPNDPEAQLRMAAAIGNAGRFLEAVPYLRRVIELDSLGLRGSSPLCRACEAEAALVRTYWAVDSFPAAERAAREWIRAQPRSSGAWAVLATTYQRMGRYVAARAARDSALRLGSPGDGADDARALSAIRGGTYAEADTYFSIQARNGAPRERESALWWLTLSLRNQGRLREALIAAERTRLVDDTAQAGFSRAAALMSKGQVLFELGRFRESAALFASLASDPPSFFAGFPGILVRHRCWSLTHEAEALAALGDTAAVLALADTIERLGPRSSYGRDRLLHHHLRGLVAMVRGDWQAAESEFRAALYSVTEGYTRTNLQLARVLLTRHHPREAIAILHSALRGGLEGSNLYITRTELHEALGQAFTMAGLPDSAAVHDRRVVRAWAHADPQFTTRVEMARARLAHADALQGQ